MKGMNVLIYPAICMLMSISSADESSSEDVLSTACGSCYCTDWQQASADCSNMGLHTIPTDLPANITDLNLARNRIQISTEIPGGLCQQYPFLTTLSLAWNGLKTLSQIFQGCKHLEHLDLMGNILDFPGPVTFHDLQNLQDLSSIEVQELQMGLFQNFKSLETLNLTLYGIIIQPGLFTGLLSLKQLTLTLEKVLALPKHMLSFNDGNVLQSLIIKGSKVKDIPDDLLKQLVNLKELYLDLPQLLELRLQENRKPQYLQVLEISHVRSLAEDTLFGLHFLKTVKLHGIGSLAIKDLFKMADTVKELEIVGCSLTELPPGWLHNMVALETLDLSENVLEKLSPVDFLNLTSLKQLILSNNKIHDLTSGFFDAVKTTLMQLLLNGNQLNKLEPATFTDLKLLQLLDLRKNTIRHISATSFSNLPRLQILRLSGNYISYLDNIVFESFPMLREIDLAENMISQFPETLMASKVVHLFLSANNLQHLPGRKMCQMGQLQKLSLEDNPVFCDCSLRSLHKCLPQLEINGKCSKPADVEGLRIEDIAECIPAVVSSAHSLQTLSLPLSTSSLLESSLTYTPVAAPLSPTPILVVLMQVSYTSPSLAASVSPSLSMISASVSPSLRMISASISPSLRMISASVSPSDSSQMSWISLNLTPNLMTPQSLISASNMKISAQISSTHSLSVSVHLSHTSGSQTWTSSGESSRLSASLGLIEETDVYYDDDGLTEIVRPLIAAGISQTSELLVVSHTDSYSTQSAEIYIYGKGNADNISDEDEITAEPKLWLNNDTHSLSPDRVQVPAMVEQLGIWSKIGDILITIFLSLAVMLGILAGIWFYRKKSQSGSYHPVTSSIDPPARNIIQMQPFVERQVVTPNQKRSNMTIETHTYVTQ